MHLNAADRRFFHLVGRAAFSNPFSQERDDLDRDVAKVTGEVPDLVHPIEGQSLPEPKSPRRVGWLGRLLGR